MKQLAMALMALFVIVGGWFALPGKAEAAYAPWVHIYGTPSSCQVRVYTDSTNYPNWSTTIDTFVQQNDYCGRLDYKAAVYVPEYGAVSNTLTGYFTHQSPTKSFYIDSLNIYTGQTNYVEVDYDLYIGSTFVGYVSSNPLSIAPR